MDCGAADIARGSPSSPQQGIGTPDALLAAMIHQAFLLGALYELDRYKQIATRLFKNLNTRLYRSSGAIKFVALLYGEVC